MITDKQDGTGGYVETKVAIRYRLNAGGHWSATLIEIERVKGTYQAGVKASRAGDD